MPQDEKGGLIQIYKPKWWSRDTPVEVYENGCLVGEEKKWCRYESVTSLNRDAPRKKTKRTNVEFENTKCIVGSTICTEFLRHCVRGLSDNLFNDERWGELCTGIKYSMDGLEVFGTFALWDNVNEGQVVFGVEAAYLSGSVEPDLWNNLGRLALLIWIKREFAYEIRDKHGSDAISFDPWNGPTSEWMVFYKSQKWTPNYDGHVHNIYKLSGIELDAFGKELVTPMRKGTTFGSKARQGEEWTEHMESLRRRVSLGS